MTTKPPLVGITAMVNHREDSTESATSSHNQPCWGGVLFISTPLKFNSSPLKTGREDDPFLLGFGNFSGAMYVELQRGYHLNLRVSRYMHDSISTTTWRLVYLQAFCFGHK